MHYYINRAYEYWLQLKARRFRSKLYTEQQLQQAPFFIVSCGRSGTTLLRKMLIQGGQVHIPPESDDLIPSSVKIFLEHINKPWPDQVRLVFDNFQQATCFKFWDLDLASTIAPLLDLPKDQQTLVSIIDHIYRTHLHAQASTAEYYGDKTPYLVQRLDWINLLFPQARIIHLIRDARAVVASRMKYFQEDLEQACRRWSIAIDGIDRIKKNGYPHLLEVKYEELVSDPENSLQRIASFLGIDFHPDMLDTSKPIDLGDTVMEHHHKTRQQITRKEIDKWKKSLSEQQQEEIIQILQTGMKQYNYL